MSQLWTDPTPGTLFFIVLVLVTTFFVVKLLYMKIYTYNPDAKLNSIQQDLGNYYQSLRPRVRQAMTQEEKACREKCGFNRFSEDTYDTLQGMTLKTDVKANMRQMLMNLAP